MIEKLPELKVVTAQIWETKIATDTLCPHLAAWRKANAARWSRFLQKVGGAYSVETVQQLVKAFNAQLVNDPLEIIADKQTRLASNFLVSRQTVTTPVYNTLTPWAQGMLAANGSGGAVLILDKEARSGAFTAGKSFLKDFRELINESASSITMAGPGIYINTDGGVVESIDNEWLARRHMLSSPGWPDSRIPGDCAHMSLLSRQREAKAAARRELI